MLKQFEQYRQEIRDLNIKLGQHTRCICKCKEYLRTLYSLENKNEARLDFWFCYHNLALNYRKIGGVNYNKIIKLEQKAINYTSCGSDSYDYKYIYSISMIGRIYEEMGNTEEAINIFNICKDFYLRIGEQTQYIVTLFNIEKVRKNTDKMLEIIRSYEEEDKKSVLKTYGDMDKDVLIKQMYSELLDLYILKDKAKAFELLYILPKDLRSELGKKLQVAQ